MSDKARNKVLDSVANVNAPRAVWGMFPDPDDIEGSDDAPRLFVQLKTNIAPKNLSGWTYKMVQRLAGQDARDGTPVMATCIQWTGKTTKSGDDIMAIENEKQSPRTEEAVAFLRRELADRDPPPFVEDVRSAADAEGIAPSTLNTAKRRLGVIATKPEEGGGKRRWIMPKVESPALIFDESSEGAIPETEGEFER